MNSLLYHLLYRKKIAKSFAKTYMIAMQSKGFHNYCKQLYQSPFLHFNLLSANQRQELFNYCEGPILDYGCGMGGFAKDAFAKGFQVWGHEIISNLELDIPMLKNLDDKTQKFKTIIAIDSFYNIPNYKKLIDRLQTLAPDGKLIIAMSFHEENHLLLQTLKKYDYHFSIYNMTADDNLFWQLNKESLALIDDSPQIYKIKKDEINSFSILKKKPHYKRLLIQINF